ncbi:putative Zn(2)-C6 fungal-type domain-containing protein [Seiridium cardinale]|uniref:Zn(2)-C6 fungal-type domain-containing protein n=1 Tax=Seiridium cardinale TaxID=138064 RepID=A0ABR2XRA9_9PEZI
MSAPMIGNLEVPVPGTAAKCHTETARPPAPRRRRPALSCLQCRASKVRCDRRIPACSRCDLAGRGSECAYRNNAPHDAVKSKPTVKPTHPRTEIEPSYPSNPVESSHHATPESQLRRGASPIRSSPAAIIGTTFLQKGADAQPQFFGQSHAMNTYSQFDEIRKHSKAVKSQNAMLERMRTDFQPPKTGPRNHASIELPKYLGLLPPPDRIQHFLDIYLRRLEPVYNILHIPTFNEELARFGQSQFNASTAFVVQLLVIISIGSILEKQPPEASMEDMSIMSRTNVERLKVAESWIQQNMDRPDLSVIRVFCILIISKRLYRLGGSQAWIATGNLVKLSMSMGYHREPAQMASISQNDREIRRRIWVTVVELDLQACADRGMPPSVRSEDFDNLLPSNIDDQPVRNKGDELGVLRPRNVRTSSSFQCATSQSLSTRLKICAMVNGPETNMRYDEVLRLDGEIAKCVQEISSWSFGCSVEPTEEETFLDSLVYLIIQNWCIILHTPFAYRSRQDSAYVNSRRARLEAATSVLCHHQAIFRTGDSTLVFFEQGAPRAALAICHELYMSNSGYSSMPVRQVLPVVVESLLSLAEGVLPMLEAAIIATGKGLNEYYVLVMVFSLIKIQLSPASASTHKKNASDQIITMGCKLYAIKAGNQPQAIPTQMPSNTEYFHADNSDEAEAHRPSAPDSVFQKEQCGFTVPDGFDLSEEFDWGGLDLWNFQGLPSF